MPDATPERIPGEEREDEHANLDELSVLAVRRAAACHDLPLERLPDLDALVANVRGEAEADYEAALVAGLCRDGALELFRDSAAQAAQRHLEALPAASH